MAAKTQLGPQAKPSVRCQQTAQPGLVTAHLRLPRRLAEGIPIWITAPVPHGCRNK